MKTTAQHIRKTIILMMVLIGGVFSTAMADGFIIIPNPRPTMSPFPLEVKYHHVDVEIDGQIATTFIDQVFYNPSSFQLEGYYLFPIPEGAVIQDFTMMINGQEMHAELLDSEKARKIYEDIVRQARDPAILEYSERGLFKVRIFPIEPRSEKKVTIKYREVLSEDNETVEYVYPLNTEKFSAKELKDVRVKVDIKNQGALKNIYSPTHNVDVVTKDEHTATVSYEEENVKPNIDFKLYFNTGSSKIGLTLLSFKEPKEDGFFFLSTSPALNYNENEISAKDITFVLDVSGSMAGEKLKKAKNALQYCIDNLNDKDRFEIIRFSTEAYALFKGLVDANDKNRDKARKFVDELKPVGGTNIDEAMQLALKNGDGGKRPHMIIFITDGKPTIGETDEDKLLKLIDDSNKEKTRVFTFGIGNEINTHLLDKITESSRAARSYITTDEDIEIKISQFYNKVQSPVLTDIEIEVSNNIELLLHYPRELPDMFRGSNLTLLGRYKGEGKATIKISGKVNGKERSFSYEKEFTDDETKFDFVPQLWAARRVGYLLDMVRLHGESKEMKDEITMLARKYGIVTPYTSYLILEDERVRSVNNTLRREYQTFGGNFDDLEAPTVEYRQEYDNMSKKSGEESVTASEEVQGLNDAANYDEMQQGRGRMNYVDRTGVERNLVQQVQNVQGRAMYQSGEFWVDSYLQETNPDEIIKIQFASEAYFELLNKDKDAAQFLALGQNVRFYSNGNYYEIYE